MQHLKHIIYREFTQDRKGVSDDTRSLCMPWKEFLFCLNFLVLCGFPHNRRVHYNDFTTLEKCSDMTKKEIVENEIFIPLYKFRNISFDFEK